MVSVDAFLLAVPEREQRDLRDRLAHVRWPDEVEAAGWDYGVPLEVLRDVAEDWRRFDWGAYQEYLNDLPNVLADFGDATMHAVVPSAEEDAIPLVLLHGWPSSYLEYLAVAEILTADAVRPRLRPILVSLPGYGFSRVPLRRGYSYEAAAAQLLELLSALGIERFSAHAHDHGAAIVGRAIASAPHRLIAYHTTEPGIPGIDVPDDEVTDELRAFRALADEWEAADGGYERIQSTRPQTLAYGLTDSPIGLAAWILDKWHAWGGENGLDGLDPDLVLGTLSLWWFTRTAGPAARAYFEGRVASRPLSREHRFDIPLGVTLTDQDIERVPRAIVERRWSNIKLWRDLGRGGHFLAARDPFDLAGSLVELHAALG